MTHDGPERPPTTRRPHAPEPREEPAAPERIVERLEALESFLLEMATEISVTRESLAGVPRAPGEHCSAPAPGESGGPTRGAVAEGRSASTGRAKLRESPLDALFRSTIHSNGEAGGRPPAEEPPPADPPPVAGEVSDPSWLEDGVAEIEPRRARMLANSERRLGRDHPDTLWAAHDLASALAKAGELDHARRLAMRLVDERIRLLGPHHPYTVRAYELRLAVAGAGSPG